MQAVRLARQHDGLPCAVLRLYRNAYARVAICLQGRNSREMVVMERTEAGEKPPFSVKNRQITAY